jgi:hypothetical protein
VFARKRLLSVAGNKTNGASATVEYFVQIPDARIRCQVRVLGGPSGAMANVASQSGLAVVLWEALCVRDYLGREIPIQNLTGTYAAGLSIVGDVGLYGHVTDVEYSGGVDGEGVASVYGRLVVTADGSNPAEIFHAEAVWSPTVELSGEEWETLRPLCALSVRGDGAL